MISRFRFGTALAVLSLSLCGFRALAQAVPDAPATTTPAAAAKPPFISFATSLRHKVVVAAYAGRPFRLSARLRADTASEGASIKLLASCFTARMQFSSVAVQDTAVTSPMWRTITLRGQLGRRDSLLMIFGQVLMNGTFGIDDVVLEVETKSHHWQAVPLSNGDFEQPLPTNAPADAAPPGWEPLNPVVGFRGRLVHESSGNTYYEVRGTEVTHYGHNRRAGHFQTVNGVRLYYETYGQGEPLLLLHGNGETIGSFTQQIGALAERYRVIAVDTRGHGQSKEDGRRLTYDLFADDMVALLDSLLLPAAHVVGWSDG
ncbi:MAG: alpha/beta hydrolase, partial [Hymenobacteraceae bacterium]|nr:alpha/beta hydrolase [Hymenobacteraceae bacterium]